MRIGGFFSKRGDGGFDYRASLISQFVGHTIQYRTRKHNDPWRFPEQTLFENRLPLAEFYITNVIDNHDNNNPIEFLGDTIFVNGRP